MSARWNINRVNTFLKHNGSPIKILDEKFDDTKTKHKWKCRLENHEFLRKFEDILKDIKNNKSPCTECSKDNTLEDRARYCFEEIFNKPFPKQYPKWLHQNKGDPKELDGYNEELKIAFEYDGAQHYELSNYYNKNEEEFKNLQYRDRLKTYRCEEKGIELIRIKYDEDFISNPSIILDKIPTKLKSKIINKDITFNNYSPHTDRSLIFKLKEYAIKKGGECRSSKIANDGKVDLYCPIHNHTWSSKPQLVLNSGSWCKYCGHNQRADKQKQNPDENELMKIGKDSDVKYQSWAGMDSKNRYLWKCTEENHFPFKKTYSEMTKALKSKKSPCPQFNKKRPRMGWEAHKYAESMGGKCLTFENKKGKQELYTFKCHNKDHSKFELTLAQIFDSQMWCKDCDLLKEKKPKRHTQHHVNEIARRKGFVLKSLYVKNTENLILKCKKCSKEHIPINFRRLESMKNGHNCDHC